MRLRKIEFIVIALTFAFVCFMGGYFAGSRGSVSFVSAPQQFEEPQQYVAVPMHTDIRETAQPATAADTVGGDMTDIASGAIADAADDSAGQKGENTESPAVVVIPGGEAAGAPRGGDGKININTASRSELMDLPGIGNVLAGRIVDYRSQYGYFSSIEDIKRVSGIGEKRFEAIMNKITVS